MYDFCNLSIRTSISSFYVIQLGNVRLFAYKVFQDQNVLSCDRLLTSHGKRTSTWGRGHGSGQVERPSSCLLAYQLPFKKVNTAWDWNGRGWISQMKTHNLSIWRRVKFYWSSSQMEWCLIYMISQKLELWKIMNINEQSAPLSVVMNGHKNRNYIHNYHDENHDETEFYQGNSNRST